MFFECGTASFKHVDGDPPEDLGCAGGGGSPGGRRKHGGKVNPYAERGLDRFSVVLSDLETRRAKILSRVGGEAGLVLVRFVQSNGRWTPVVVKLPGEPLKGAASAAATKPRAAPKTAPPPSPPAPASPGARPLHPAASPRERVEVKKKATTEQVPAKRASFSRGRRVRRPSHYWPAVIVLTLVSLNVFGRAFAICLTSICWYVLPTLGSGCSDGAGEDAPWGGLRMSMEKRKPVLPPPQPAKKGSSCGLYEVATSSARGHAKGKRG